MKKKLVKLVLSLLTVFLLSACRSNNTDPQEVFSQTEAEQTEKETKEQTTSSSSSKEVTEAEVSDEELYASTLEKVAADTTEGHATLYCFYDIDKNGSNELLTGYMASNGKPALLAIYYLKNGISTYLSRSYVASAGGDRESTDIYDDGTVYFAQWSSGTGAGTAYLYQLKADNSGYDILKEQNFDMSAGDEIPTFKNGRSAVDISRLDWKSFQEKTNDTSQKDLNIDEINSGNFQSLAGIWKNGKGETLEITSDGKVNGTMTLQGVKDSGNKSEVPYASLRSGNTGAALALFKIGFKNPRGDQSDTSKPRILVTQNAGNYPAEEYYYRQ